MANMSKTQGNPTQNPGVAFADKYKALGKLWQYPPFSTDHDKSEEFIGDLHGASRKVAALVAADRDSDDPADEGSPEHARLYEGAFDGIEEKWGDDLDIARLYVTRYGDDYFSAQEAALELEGKSTNDPGVPVLD